MQSMQTVPRPMARPRAVPERPQLGSPEQYGAPGGCAGKGGADGGGGGGGAGDGEAGGGGGEGGGGEGAGAGPVVVPSAIFVLLLAFRPSIVCYRTHVSLTLECLRARVP